MFVQAYGAAAVILVSSVVFGRAICRVCGGGGEWWAAPVIGLAGLIVLCGASVELPGHAVTASLICGVFLLIALGYLVWSRVRIASATDGAVAAAAFVATSVPFISSGRVGLPGASLDNDLAIHLLYAEALRSSRMASLWGVHNGYPLGSHSVVAVLGTSSGIPLDAVFTGLLIAVVGITALAGQGIVVQEAGWRRGVVGLCCAIPYLVAAYYGEGAFKETIMAALLLGFVVELDQVRDRWAPATAAARWRMLLPAGLLMVASIYTYSTFGIAWFLASLGVWGVAEVARRPVAARALLSRRSISLAAPWIGTSAVLGTILVLPVAGQALSFIHAVGGLSPAGGAIPKSNLGNLAGPLSPYEALGIWWSPEFRRAPSNAFHAGQLSVLAFSVLALGLLWSVRRARFLLPSAVVGSGLIWLYSNHTQSPYVTAKALVIMSPITVAIGLRALLTRSDRGVSMQRLSLCVAAAFVGCVFYSSYESLRSEPVQAPEAGRELARFERRIGNSSVLFLGVDDFAPWQLRPAAVSTLSTPTPSVGAVIPSANKPYVSSQPLDFDSVSPVSLDRVSYVITTNTRYASQAPPNFQLIARAPLYELWRRTGPTPERSAIEAPGTPGAVLRCSGPAVQRLISQHGHAALMAMPLLLPGAVIVPGSSAVIPLRLPQGAWGLSVQTVNSFELVVTAQGHRWTLPAYLGRPGPFFDVGVVSSVGASSPVFLRVTVPRPSVVTGRNLAVGIGSIAAVRVPDRRELTSLKQACGKYLDWFRLTGNR